MPSEQNKQELNWDLSTLYPNLDAWEADWSELEAGASAVQEFKGKLGDSAKSLLAALEARDSLERRVNKLYVYSHLKSDENTQDSKALAQLDRIRSHWTKIESELAWLEPEILRIPENDLNEMLKDEVLSQWKRTIDQIVRCRKHTLGEKEEALLMMAAEPLHACEKAYSQLSDADLKFPDVEDKQGNLIPLTQGSFSLFLENQDRDLRARAFDNIYETYGKLKNVYSALIDGQVRSNVFYARARNFDSALASGLFDDNVPNSVYSSLIDSVHSALPSLHRYFGLRKKLLNLDELQFHDLYVSIVPKFDLKVEYDQAREWVLDSVKPLGGEYQEAAAKAFSERWIDVREKPGKRSGAYSSGCYDSNPFILMNYQDNLDSVFTLAHELGHSLHSYFSYRNQPHRTAGYRIFVAEVASTTNELLLLDHLLKQKPDDKKFRAYLLNHFLETFRGTLFRQTMFAEFERKIHELVESGGSLTPDELTKQYYELTKTYHGDGVNLDPRLGLEWARIPHFYYNFYVYKYATGLSAALVFSRAILSGDQKKIDAYLGFLKAGGSKDPLDILNDAGCDLSNPKVVETGLAAMADIVTEIEEALV